LANNKFGDICRLNQATDVWATDPNFNPNADPTNVTLLSLRRLSCEWFESAAGVTQVLTSEGLLRYVDSRCVQRELSEVAGVSDQQQLDDAARELLYMRQHDAQSVAARRPPFYEHLGGYGMHELHDYNQYSNRPIATTSASGSGVLSWWHRRRHRATSRDKSPATAQTRPTDETTMYITSV